ncbi:hypothetical protein F4818DRAFT_436610 [Hypoxylon cercidicola]|nr:hypothetical protein F4818DRAFT_436610 [Hypoxylon cercidicola]
MPSVDIQRSNQYIFLPPLIFDDTSPQSSLQNGPRATASNPTKSDYALLESGSEPLSFQAFPIPISKGFKRRLRAGLAELMSREYWQRAWTTREAAMSQSCFVLCGSSKPLRMELFAQGHLQLATFCGFGFEYAYSIYRLHLPYLVELEDGPEALCTKKATLAVDKIYDIRAMFAKSLGPLPVDYSRPTVDVETEGGQGPFVAPKNCPQKRSWHKVAVGFAAGNIGRLLLCASIHPSILETCQRSVSLHD